MGRHGGTAHYYVCGTQVSIINIEIGWRKDSDREHDSVAASSSSPAILMMMLVSELMDDG